ncbi:S-adenosyl-L-methionine-dependent methyltransferase [Aureobasidium melanogenum CBS 110374]|uniref:tRNA (adenine(58)-N(1))-methyltransferase catalytic subunit TRM61 n=1 Tax=Aureobasidium melanogenum (strain CBS 110374) TaxID=1043003 RepID=A0A074VNT3_AURM1|nr:S-adenosyl-L-methionine-dependent methyltransferase [Aureobasidium melanogenum CBS 110374]KEQ60769.1 S-adenosyl-L-methionine-dependent methyltransferase [Aureobasidium melanogenum CBS 110374]
MRIVAAPLHRVCRQHRTLSTFIERDVVILRQKLNQDNIIVTKPLNPANKISTHKGDISHADIIGKSPRDLVTSSAGHEYRIHTITLAEYVSLTRRLVTPIYPADANLIVSLFDLHPSAAEDAEKIEVLEAGTGHGALTLHLSRAIHGANSQPPRPALVSESADDQPASRKAIIHTIDISPKYSKHAAKIVAGFRHGIYAGNVDFHVGDVSEWIQSEHVRRDSEEPFLTHAFLDLPATHDHLAAAASALKKDGTLIIFNPSITQILDCIQKIKRENIPLFLDQTLELGNNGSSGGKPWDLRAVKPRASSKNQSTDVGSDSAQSSGSESLDESITRDQTQALKEAKPEDPNWTFVCRPKVGERITGGGFLGIFRKMKDTARP